MPIGVKLRRMDVKLEPEFVVSEFLGPRAADNQRREVSESPTSRTRCVMRILFVGIFEYFVDVNRGVRVEPNRQTCWVITRVATFNTKFLDDCENLIL